MGARRVHVVNLVLGQMLMLVCIGVIVGLGASVLVNQTIRRTIFGVTLYDPLTIIVDVVMVGAVTLLASYQPLRPASRIDPTIALTSDQLMAGSKTTQNRI